MKLECYACGKPIPSQGHTYNGQCQEGKKAEVIVERIEPRALPEPEKPFVVVPKAIEGEAKEFFGPKVDVIPSERLPDPKRTTLGMRKQKAWEERQSPSPGQWKREYMREYMRKYRARKKADGTH